MPDGEAALVSAEKRDEHGRFIVPPISPGRPKGSRNKLGEDFLRELAADFDQHGAEAIQKVREEKPEQYIKVIASILPKEFDIGDNLMSALKESRDAAAGAFYRSMSDEAAEVVH